MFNWLKKNKTVKFSNDNPIRFQKDIENTSSSVGNEILKRYENETFGTQDVIKSAVLVVENQNASTSFLQRELKAGYNRVGNILDALESMAIVGGFKGAKAREVLIKNLNHLDEILKKTNLTDLVRFNILFPYDYKKELAKKEGWNEDEQSFYEWEKEKEIRAKIVERQKQKDLHRKVKEKMMNEGLIPNIHTKRREHISQETKDLVWNRDNGKCVECGNNENLEFDHIVPFSKGGSNTYRNLQLLCETCNRKKSNKIG